MAVHSLPVPSSNGGKAPRRTQPVSFYGQSVFSKYYAHSICAFLLLVPFLVMPVQAQAGQGPIDTTNCVTNYDASADYFSSKIQGKSIRIPRFRPSSYQLLLFVVLFLFLFLTSSLFLICLPPQSMMPPFSVSVTKKTTRS